jgi:hypothetical protein
MTNNDFNVKCSNGTRLKQTILEFNLHLLSQTYNKNLFLFFSLQRMSIN